MCINRKLGGRVLAKRRAAVVAMARAAVKQICGGVISTVIGRRMPRGARRLRGMLWHATRARRRIAPRMINWRMRDGVFIFFGNSEK